MSVIMFINLKGGVAKTTNAVVIAECLASLGYKTMMIDADHQCMAGEVLLGEKRQLHCEKQRKTLHDLLALMLSDDFESNRFGDFVVSKASNIGGGLDKLCVLPCSIRIDDFVTNMAKAKKGYRSNDDFLAVFRRRKKQMKKWLSAYDFVIVDCPPSLAIQVKILLSVADCYIVPSIPDRLSVRGIFYLMERLQSHGFKLKGLGTLWTLFSANNAIHKRVVEYAESRKSPLDGIPEPFQIRIPNTVEMTRALESDNAAPSTFSKKYPLLAAEYKKLCQEIVKRVEWAGAEQVEAHV